MRLDFYAKSLQYDDEHKKVNLFVCQAIEEMTMKDIFDFMGMARLSRLDKTEEGASSASTLAKTAQMDIVTSEA